MDKKSASYIIIGLLILQIILVILIYLQYPFLSYEQQRNAGIFVAILLFVMAAIIHIYDKAFKSGEDRIIEIEAEG